MFNNINLISKKNQFEMALVRSTPSQSAMANREDTALIKAALIHKSIITTVAGICNLCSEIHASASSWQACLRI
jgi:hypothetical protein